MEQQAAHQLRAPFPDDEVHHLPKVWCAACRRASGKACETHRQQTCRTCGAYVTTAHLDLAYVGHAETTDRLLSVDPEWSWEPTAWATDGLPAFDLLGGLWIRLTVAGVTRLGYGHADGKTGGDAVKETIGDAIRNAAMRFGVALDLWRRGHTPEAPVQAGSPAQLRTEIANLAKRKGYEIATVDSDFTQVMNGADIRNAGVAELAEYRDRFKGYDSVGTQ